MFFITKYFVYYFYIMRPLLSNKNIIVELINEYKTHKPKTIKIDNTNYFNLVIIFLIIISILFLIFRYIEKKNRSNNYIVKDET